jgi:RimJ/RimL family protein N-acetyltransferase
MRPGTIIRKFQDQDGREVTLRAPQWSDLDDMLEVINSLIDEETYIINDTTVTREAEVDWLARKLSSLENDQAIAVVAEVDGHFVGQTEITPMIGCSRHVGVLGIALKDGYRDAGIGTELLREAENQAPRLGLEIITLDVFAPNARGRHLYEKIGYNQVGRLPRGVKWGGDYVDSIIMSKVLPEAPPLDS